MTDVKNLKVLCFTDKSKEPLEAIDWSDGSPENDRQLSKLESRLTDNCDPRAVSAIMSFDEALEQDIVHMDTMCEDVISTMVNEFTADIFDALEESSISKANDLLDRLREVIKDF
jgi:archaellum component FlaC